METITLNSLRKDPNTSLQKVADSHVPLLVKQPSGDDVVILSLADYNSIEETIYLTKNPAYGRRLYERIQQLKQGVAGKRVAYA